MLARLSALVIWGLVAATSVFWGLRLLTRAPAVPANAIAVVDGGAGRGDLTRLLGAPPVEAPAAMIAPEVASRFALIGVMAPKATAPAGPRRRGVALIAVDGKPPKAFIVGAVLDGDLVLQSVSLRSASIGPARGDEALKLELPALPPPATGTPPGLANPARPGARGIAPVPPAVGFGTQPEQMQQQPRPPMVDQARQRDMSDAPTE